MILCGNAKHCRRQMSGTSLKKINNKIKQKVVVLSWFFFKSNFLQPSVLKSGLTFPQMSLKQGKSMQMLGPLCKFLSLSDAFHLNSEVCITKLCTGLWSFRFSMLSSTSHLFKTIQLEEELYNSLVEWRNIFHLLNLIKKNKKIYFKKVKNINEMDFALISNFCIVSISAGS